MAIFAGYNPGPPQKQNLEGIPGAFGLYNTAVEQQAGDYGNIMKQYQGFNSSQPMQNFGELASTGGYSEADKQNLRERGVSPVRSIYASANRDVDRQKALQGGYSPNYAAVKAKMARDLSQDIGDRVTSVNAGIAQNVAQNRVSLAPQYASAAFNPIQAQQSLYSATPGLASLYGNMANQQARLQADINKSGGGGYGGSPNAGMPSNINYKPSTVGQFTGGMSY